MKLARNTVFRASLRLALPAVAAAVLAGCASLLPPPEPVKVKVLAINDFHGNLKPPQGGIRLRDAAGKLVPVEAGGAEHLATAVAQIRAKNPNHVFVAAGDLIGATPLLSALFRDEPTIESLSLMGLEVSAVGNHEFDKGAAELLRMQHGGCVPESCKGPAPFAGARFQYLAASTIDVKTGKTLLPATFVKTFQGIPVGFIGLTLKGTPAIVAPAGVVGLRFDDEAETVNRLVPGLQSQGVQAIVVLIHEGGVPTGDYNECPGISGPVVDIVKKLDKAVDAVISGHTHRAYNCRIDGRLVTSGDKYGTIVTEIDLVLDPATRDVISATADNVVVRPASFAKDPRQTTLIAQYEKLAAPLAGRVVGQLGAPLPRQNNAAGENPLGQVIADAQLAATRDAGAQLALMNPGGIRAALDMPADGQVRYADLFAVQPFYNNLMTMTLTGAQLLQLLEEQWSNRNDGGRVLHVSQGFSYSWDAKAPVGQRIVPGSVRINGRPLDPAADVRITVNSFLGGGGDNFQVLRQGRDRRTGMMDVDALELYVKANPTLAPGPLNRITRLN
ncbi:MAG: bifunctional metallophosphatase/5'-nucleotidase [Leptothrix sp. (in: Bacteria)]|nr:bifunctional metallophosphatase/5'-nucleotidase [Leptothrix sp. (in: b-proteobacteria)]